MRMRPDQPCAVKRKRKHSRKTLEDTETTTSPMASRKCQEQVSPEESGDDGLTSAKRPKCANDDEATTGPPALGLPDCQEQDEAEGETASAWPEITVVLSVGSSSALLILLSCILMTSFSRRRRTHNVKICSSHRRGQVPSSRSGYRL